MDLELASRTSTTNQATHDVFTETDTTGMRADWDTGLGGHHEDGEDLVDTGETA